MIKQNLKDPALRKSFEQQIRKSLELKKAHQQKMQQIEEEVAGMKLKKQEQEQPEGDTASALKIIGLLISGTILAMLIGNWKKKRRK